MTGTGSFGNVACTGTGSFGGVQATGDLVYNAGKSLTSQMNTLTGYKTSGTISGTTAFQTIYSVALGTRGFITVIAVAPNYNMFMGFFRMDYKRNLPISHSNGASRQCHPTSFKHDKRKQRRHRDSDGPTSFEHRPHSSKSRSKRYDQLVRDSDMKPLL